MQPNEYRSEPYEPPRDWDLSGFPTEPVVVHRTRSWAVALAAFLTGLAIIGALGNPPVTRAITRHITPNHTFKDGVLASLTSVQWRFGAGQGDTIREWAAHLVANGAFLVLLFLLVWIVARARGGFWQAFFGTWACAVAAAMVASYAGVAELNTTALERAGNTSKLYFVFFGPLTAGTTTLFGALMFGFVIALVAGLVAVASRKREVLVEAGPNGELPPQSFFPPPQQPHDTAGYPPVPGPVAAPSPWSGRGEGDYPTEAMPRTEGQDHAPQPTDVLPPMTKREDEQHTTQLPRTDEPTGEASETSTGETSGGTSGESGGNDSERGNDIWGTPRREG